MADGPTNHTPPEDEGPAAHETEPGPWPTPPPEELGELAGASTTTSHVPAWAVPLPDRGRDPEQEKLLDGIRQHPEDDLPRLVYADWLEDNGQPERAELIRVQIVLSRLPG